MITRQRLEKIHDRLWELPKSYRGDMHVPARVYATEEMLDSIVSDRALEQLVNVATLRGIRKYALAMPDVHEGYGFPIGGVAAFDPDDGVISPGGIGYDINCGVRLLRSQLSRGDVQEKLQDLVDAIAREVPSGVGKGGRLQMKEHELDKVLASGSERMVELGHGDTRDLERQESRGNLTGADPAAVSSQAKQRGRDQLGTMGAGNHFVEIDAVDHIFDDGEAKRLGIFPGQILVLIHTGSRGLGHQIATDYLRSMTKAMPKYKVTVADRELASVPFRSAEGQRYFQAMAAGANFAWANRQLITWEARRAWEQVLGKSGGELEIVYDVAHNVAKLEEHRVGQNTQQLLVHRKGATRAFPGQPVLIPGSMGTASYLLVGSEKAMEESFGSSCHGAGRRMSRSQAKRQIDGVELKGRLKSLGIIVHGGSMPGLVEEAPEAYKDIDSVIDVVHEAGIARRVARVKPIGVVKG